APYVPPTVPVVPTAGRLTLDLQVKTSRPPEGPLRLIVGGIVGLADVAVLRRGAPAPLLRVPRINVVVKDARPLDSLITLAALEVDGLDLSGVRYRPGQIDLLSLARPADTAAPPAPPSARPPASPPAGGGAPAPVAGGAGGGAAPGRCWRARRRRHRCGSRSSAWRSPRRVSRSATRRSRR